jgi:hypothetical protein
MPLTDGLLETLAQHAAYSPTSSPQRSKTSHIGVTFD